MADGDSLYELSSDQDVDPDAIDGDAENDDTADDGATEARKKSRKKKLRRPRGIEKSSGDSDSQTLSEDQEAQDGHHHHHHHHHEGHVYQQKKKEETNHMSGSGAEADNEGQGSQMDFRRIPPSAEKTDEQGDGAASQEILAAGDGHPDMGALSRAQIQKTVKELEMLSMVASGAPKNMDEATKKRYQFWETQPVPRLNEKVIGNEEIEQDKPTDEIRQETYSLPQGFRWDTLDISDPLISYASRSKGLDDFDESLAGDLTAVEKKLLESQDLMKIRGKRGRPVPVIVPADVRTTLSFLADRKERRAAGIDGSNPYLFPNSANSYARAYESLKTVCCDLNLRAPHQITSVSMRKYTATLTQMLDLGKNQMDWVYQHLGHTKAVHKEHYRQMSGLLERTQVSKMFLIQDLNLTGKFKGRKLDEIDISGILRPTDNIFERLIEAKVQLFYSVLVNLFFTLKELYTLLNENYVEDDDNMFRFDYSPEFLQWALQPPGWRKDWHCGVRVVKSSKLVGFISAVPAHVKIYDKTKHMVEINFLCVHKKLRSKRVAPVLIREITRRVHLKGLFQAVYTAGVVLPKPVACCRYWHRSLNPKKLIEVKFSHLTRNMTMQRTLKLYKLPDTTKVQGFRPFTPADVKDSFNLLCKYLNDLDLAPVFTEEEFRHWFIPRGGIINSYVVENNGTITDFVSFYTLPSTVMHHPVHKTLKAAYSFYNVATVTPWVDLMQDALIVAKNSGFDVFNALDLMQNKQFLEKLKFGIGDGNLQYYLYNWRCTQMEPNQVGLVLQ